MGAKQLSRLDPRDVISLCRRLATALQSGRPVLSAMDAAAEGVPARLRQPLRAIRQRLRAGGAISEVLAELKVPSFIRGTVRCGELSNTLERALGLIIGRLESEQAARPVRDRKLYSYSLAFGRLGMMLSAGVPIGTALSAAGESVGRSGARQVLMAAAREVGSRGADLSEALERDAPGLPPMTVEMVRDGEREGRLDEALSVIADYLLDEAGQKPAPARK